MNQIKQNNQKFVITKKGDTIAETGSLTSKPIKSMRGMMEGKAKITGDIMAPFDIKWNTEK